MRDKLEGGSCWCFCPGCVAPWLEEVFSRSWLNGSNCFRGENGTFCWRPVPNVINKRQSPDVGAAGAFGTMNVGPPGVSMGELSSARQAFQLDRDQFCRNLRSARKGAAGGLSVSLSCDHRTLATFVGRRARTPPVGRGCRTVSQSRSATRGHAIGCEEEVDGIGQAGRRGSRHSGRRRSGPDHSSRRQRLHTNVPCRRGQGVSVWRTHSKDWSSWTQIRP